MKAVVAFLRRFRLVVGALCALLCALWSAQAPLFWLPSTIGRPYEQNPNGVVAHNGQGTYANDDDSVRVVVGLAKKPTFASTFSYWTGSWVQSELGPPTPFGPYFRPLTSQLWWIERHLAGPNSLFVFLLIHVLWHLAFTLALWATLRVWWSDKGALLCLWLWCLGAPAFLNLYAAPFAALMMWKDDPEMTVGLCVLGAMAATRAFVLTSRKRWIVWALLAFALSLSFKESGYVTPFFVAFTLWRFGAAKTQWRSLPLFFGATILFFAYRTWALQGMGGYHGGNKSWLPRAVNEVGGGAISAGVWAGNAMSFSLAALVFGILQWRWSRRRSLFWIAVCVASWVWAELNSVQWGDALIQLCDLSTENAIFMALPRVLLVLALWQLFVLRRPPAMLWGYGWVVLAYLPLLKQAVTPHGFYFLSVGWAWWVAGAVAWIYSQGRQLLQGERFQTAVRETYSRRYPRARPPEAPGAT